MIGTHAHLCCPTTACSNASSSCPDKQLCHAYTQFIMWDQQRVASRVNQVG